MTLRLLCPLLLLCAPLVAGDAREDWAAVTALDAGPGGLPKSADEAISVSLAHLDRQEKLLRGFIAAYPTDANAFEAHLRLVRLLSLRARMKGEPSPAEIQILLRSAELRASTPAQLTELDFARLIQRMRQWQAKRPPADERRGLLDQTRTFERAHPGDRRIAALLAEVATLFDGDPNLKESILRDAKKIAKEPELKAQIADDLKRLDLFGKALPLRFTALDGRRVDARDWRGKIVAVIFFATFSEPSKAGFLELQRTVAEAGNDSLLVAISLDSSRTALETFLREQKATCPVAWDGKGWNGPLIQALGINALPTAWLLDRRSALRSLDVLEDPAGQIRSLLRSE
jgi:hypothetical protein